MKRLKSYMVLILCFAVYDALVKHTTEFSVNLNVFFYVSLYGFFLYDMHLTIRETRQKIVKRIIYILASVILLRFLLNLLGIGEAYSEYSDLVSNPFIDFYTWTALILSLIGLLLWASLKYTPKS